MCAVEQSFAADLTSQPAAARGLLGRSPEKCHRERRIAQQAQPGLRLRGLRIALGGWIAATLLGCASPAPQVQPAPPPLPDGARVSDLRVELSASVGPAERKSLERVDAHQLLRLSALDWFEHEKRFDPNGSVEIRVEVIALSLRAAAAVWLWPDMGSPDALTVRVYLRLQNETREAFTWEEQTRVGGWEWRDADARLERLARRLGRRIAELL